MVTTRLPSTSLIGVAQDAHGLVVDQHRAGAAHGLAAAELRAGEAEVVAQHPQQHAVSSTVTRVGVPLSVKDTGRMGVLRRAGSIGPDARGEVILN